MQKYLALCYIVCLFSHFVVAGDFSDCPTSATLTVTVAGQQLTINMLQLVNNSRDDSALPYFGAVRVLTLGNPPVKVSLTSYYLDGPSKNYDPVKSHWANYKMLLGKLGDNLPYPKVLACAYNSKDRFTKDPDGPSKGILHIIQEPFLYNFERDKNEILKHPPKKWIGFYINMLEGIKALWDQGYRNDNISPDTFSMDIDNNKVYMMDYSEIKAIKKGYGKIRNIEYSLSRAFPDGYSSPYGSIASVFIILGFEQTAIRDENGYLKDKDLLKWMMSCAGKIGDAAQKGITTDCFYSMMLVPEMALKKAGFCVKDNDLTATPGKYGTESLCRDMAFYFYSDPTKTGVTLETAIANTKAWQNALQRRALQLTI